MKHKTRSRKAQSETLGLVIVVMLIIAGIAVMMFLTGDKPKDRVIENYANKLAGNTLYATLNMHSDNCNADLFGDVLKDCVNGDNRLRCNVEGVGELDSCDYSELMLGEILEWTIPYDYYFEITGTGDRDITIGVNRGDKVEGMAEAKFKLPSRFGVDNLALLWIYP